jgi:hypothetical protein
MLLCGLRHEPPILDGDGDIVSNLKSTSMFERFPCFRWFNWKDIQIKRNHVRYSERYLIATSFPRFHFREAPWDCDTDASDFSSMGGGVRGHLFFTIKKLQME